MKEFKILVLLYFSAAILKGQNIEIGQDAYETMSIIESSTGEHNRIQHGKEANAYWDWDYTVYDDKISQVVQCYCNETVSGLGNVGYYCTHYIFKDERLAYISTMFNDIDVKAINKYLQENFGKYKIGQYYFSNDYNYYLVVEVLRTGIVSVEWRRAEWEELTTALQDTISSRLQEEGETAQLNSDGSNVGSQRENEIKSKTYDLQIHDSAAYNLFINELRKSLINGLQNNSAFPGWDEIEDSEERRFDFKNSYDALYRIYDQSKLRSDIRYLFMPDDGVFADQNYFKLVSGNDTACDFLYYFSPSLPSTKKDGYDVATDARVTGIDVSYIKGITHVKIRDGAVNYRKYPPPPEIRELISDSLKKSGNGLYEIKYQAGTVMDSTFVNTEQKKMATVGGTIAATILVATLCVFYYWGDDE